MSSTPTSSFDFQNFFSTTITSDIAAGTLVIPLDAAPTPSEGILVIDPDATNPEIIYYTSKGASSVTCPADGRGWESTTAAAHTQGTTVIMAPTAYILRMLKSGSLFDSYATGWVNSTAPNTITHNGNRSYTCVYSGTDLTTSLSPGMRVRMTRTAAAPTKSTSLNGTTQYYSKSSPAGMTFTDDFTASAWIKLSSYNGSDMKIASRYNGTSGWAFYIDSVGRLTLLGYNAGSANFSYVQTYQSVPLNKWVHVAAQLDMSTFTATTTSSYTMLDGVDVGAVVGRAGTNPTALIQAGNLEIGSHNGGLLPFPGKIAQVAIYSAKVTQATIKASISQGLTGSETNLVSAYSFNNAITDLNATSANDLTANGSAVATNADSPFGQLADGTISTNKYEFGIIQSATFSTDTTLVIQVPEGNAFPSTGGVSAMAYSVMKVPYGMPIQRGKWKILSEHIQSSNQGSAVDGTWYNIGSQQLNIPIGEWEVSYQTSGIIVATGNAIFYQTVSTANNTESDLDFTTENQITGGSSGYAATRYRRKSISVSAMSPYYLNSKQRAGTSVTIYNADTPTASPPSLLEAENAYL